jgi:DNA polymerase-3 subunit delta
MLPYAAFNLDKTFLKSSNGLQPRRVYGTLGDAFLQKRVAGALIKRILSDEAGDFNLDVLDGETSTVTDVLARTGSLPFLSDYRVVHVQRAERIEGLHRSGEEAGEKASDDKSGTGKSKQSPASRLSEGLKNLPETTVLILSRTPETPEPGSRPGTPRCVNAAVDKVIEDKDAAGGLIIDCTIGTKDGARASDVVLQEANARGIILAENAARHIVERAGHDIANLISELEKCALRAGPGEPVTPAIIDEMTRRLPQDTIFDLTDAIGEQRTPRALGLLRELTEGGEAAELILVMLVRHLRQLLQARAFLDAGLALDAGLLRRMPPALAAQLPNDGRENIATLLQSQSWMGRRLSQQARNFSTPQLRDALEAALQVDLAMKGIEGDGGSSEMLLELLITRLS